MSSDITTQRITRAEHIGFVCAILALLIFPPLFALATLLIGIRSCIHGRTGPGIALIVLAPIVLALGAGAGAIVGTYY